MKGSVFLSLSEVFMWHTYWSKKNISLCHKNSCQKSVKLWESIIFRLYLVCILLKEYWHFKHSAEFLQWEWIVLFSYYLKLISDLIKTTLFQSSCGEFALLFYCMDHSVTCSMSIVSKKKSNNFIFYACVSTKLNIVYIVYNVCKYWFHTK